MYENINEPGILQRLLDGDEEAWERVLDCIRDIVKRKLYSRPLPPDLDFSKAIEEYTGATTELLFKELKNIQDETNLSGYLGFLVRTAMTDPPFKNLLRAITRFLEKYASLQLVRPSALDRIIAQQENGHRLILEAFINGEKIELSRTRIWYAARKALIDDKSFNQLVARLASEGISQAKSVQKWKKVVDSANKQARASWGDPDEDEDQFHIQSDIDMVEIFKYDMLRECLSELNSNYPKQYIAINLKFYRGLSYKEMSQWLDVKETVLRKRVSRGLKFLRTHAENKLL